MAQAVKHLSTMRETRVQSLVWEVPLEKEMAMHSSTIACKIPWTEEPGRLQFMRSQRVGHDWAAELNWTENENIDTYGASQVVLVVKNQSANVGDIREVGSVPGLGRSPGGGHSNPLQYSCLENPMGRGARWGTVHGVTKSRTWLSDFNFLYFR